MLFILAMQQYQNSNDYVDKSIENDPTRSTLFKEAMQAQSKILQQKLKQQIRQIQQELYSDNTFDDFELEEEEKNNEEDIFNELNENNLVQNFLENSEYTNHHHKKKFKKQKSLFNSIVEKKINRNISNKLQNNKCAICLDDLSKGKHISYLPCCHVYHSKCIKKWLKVSNLCPLCKEEVNS